MKKIAITGPESSGKSTLASALSKHFGVAWIPEYAREYLNNIKREYIPKDLDHIALEQERLVLEAANSSSGLLIADTEMLVMKVWTKVVFGCVSETVRESLERQHFDIYLVCAPDLPWEDDPLREHPGRREEIFHLYLEELKSLSLPYGVVTGQGDERISNALSILNAHGISSNSDS